jgi:hypothetical protein
LIPAEIEVREQHPKDFIEGTIDEFVAKMVAAHEAGWDDTKYGKRFVDAEPYTDPDADDEEED